MKQKPLSTQAPSKQCSPFGLPTQESVGVVGRVVVERVVVAWVVAVVTVGEVEVSVVLMLLDIAFEETTTVPVKLG